MNRKQRLFNRLQSWLPQQLLSKLMYYMTRLTWRPWKNWQINWFIRRFDVDMQEAELPMAADYPHFNAFFTRALKGGVRSSAEDDRTTISVVSPVDGRVSQYGDIRDTTVIQAKGHEYSITNLLAGDRQLAAQFHNGVFATLYLAPRDYHRIHMPCDGRLQRMIHVPGSRFAVNETSVAGIPGLFARNERLVNIFSTPAGPMALIMVGAIFVGSMETVWTDTLPARKRGECSDYDYRNARINLKRGAEMGRFNMGSTVILLFPSEKIRWNTRLQASERIRLGETMGTFQKA